MAIAATKKAKPTKAKPVAKVVTKAAPKTTTVAQNYNDPKLNISLAGTKIDGTKLVGEHADADIKINWQTFPWPWDDNTVEEITLDHVLETIEETQTFKKLWQEIHRICKNDAKINVISLHPFHERYIGDPNCVRPIVPRTLAMLSKQNNKRWAEQKYLASRLGDELNVDFEITSARFGLDPIWIKRMQEKKMTEQELPFAIRTYNNVAQENYLELKVIKTE